MALKFKGNKTLFESREAAIKGVEALGLQFRQPALVKYLNEKGVMKIMLAFGTGEDKKVEYIGDYDGVYAPINHTHNYAGSDIPGGPANSLKHTFGVLLDGSSPAITFNGSKNVSVDITPEAIHASRDNHTHSSNKIISLEGYTIGTKSGAQEKIQVDDTLNIAIGKIEYAIHNLWEVNSLSFTNGDSFIPGKIEFTGESPLIKFGNSLQIQKLNDSLIYSGSSVFNHNVNFKSSIVVDNTISSKGPISTNSSLTVKGSSSIDGILTVNNDTESTNVGSGAVIILGGISVNKNLNVGGSTNIAGNLEVSGKINVGEIEGNASTATKLQTPRNINGTAFDGSENITTKYWGNPRKISLSGEVHGEVTVDGTKDVDIKVTTTLAEDLPLIGLSISPTWTYSGGTSNSSSLIVEKGESVNFSGTWKWIHDDSHKDPETCSGPFGSSLPDSNTNSEILTSNNIKTNTTFTQTIKAKQKGYKVVDSKVVSANEEDSKTTSVSITFRDRLFYGKLTTLTPTEKDIKQLSNELVATKSKTISGITCNKGEYYCYAYPESLGNLTGIIQDGATPVLSAFNLTKLQLTNAHGLEINLNVYISANDGAFNNVKLQFS